ncbi:MULTISPECIES: TetR/AcrR family transcriptional regulator [unclassified Pseudoalteromonas]|uniref:TetR/AcrR family transcriptional regulator n=1 Tax=unclassified Pseudoalteromonas TaxID=194690 RepID=UPI000CF71FC7|nr:MULTISPECIES: TetR/AcrR family transcriptional regulator [unclassified Pseudoalteromonas]MBS3797842.1 TetR/AcrR family transcriptional regulator [Pseudoalteromonas sp. BDTF-M6]
MSQKRQLLVDTALTLFYRNGINSIGINEILNVSGVAKRTLYAYFQSKEALVLAALQQRHDTFAAWLETVLTGAKSDEEVVLKLFSALESWFNDGESQLGDFRGCFFINTSAEFSDVNSDILRFCHHHKEATREIIARHLKSADGLLLDAICLMKEGAIVSAHLGGKKQLITKRCIDILHTFATKSPE